jgi:hypothetical protein
VLIPAETYYPRRGLLMRNHSKLLLPAAALWLPLAASAQGGAPAPADDPAQQMTYAGIGFAQVSTNFDNVKPAVNLTGVIGIHPPGTNWLAGELELGTTISSGDVSTQPAAAAANCGGVLQPPCPAAGSAAPGHFSLQHAAVFGVLRTPGLVYGIGRIGYQYISTSLPQLDGHHSGLAWSLGGGWRYRPASITGLELLYTQVSNHVRYLGLGLNYSFGASKAPTKKSTNANDQ